MTDIKKKIVADEEGRCPFCGSTALVCLGESVDKYEPDKYTYEHLLCAECGARFKAEYKKVFVVNSVDYEEARVGETIKFVAQEPLCRLN